MLSIKGVGGAGAAGVVLVLPLLAGAREPQTPRNAPVPRVSYARQVRPLFEKQCVGCHSGPGAASGYRMETRALLLKGGRHGVAATPGQGEKSALVRYLTGEMMPRMPSGLPAWDKETIALVRRWIDEGAAFDAMPTPAASAAKKPASPLPAAPASPVARVAPVTALAFSPDGKYLAAGGYRAVRLLDPATGQVARTLAGPGDQVQAAAWSADGKVLAVAGGVPGAGGEVVLLDAESGRVVRRLGSSGKDGHADVVTAVAWRAGTRELATGSSDKTVRIWDADTGRCLRALKEHADAVLSLAYSPDGKYLVTGGADRSAKLFDAATGKPLQTLIAHEDAVTQVAFRPDGALLATAGADKKVRFWKVEPGKMLNPERQQEEGAAILSCAFSADGGFFSYGTVNQVVKVFTGDGKDHRKTLPDVPDWVYALAFSRDGKRLAAGSQDGTVLLYDVAEGKRLASVRLGGDGGGGTTGGKGSAR